ncbi:MAG: hypothetical protein ACTS27_11590, partial [Phycisphaerales bacterium]
MSIVRREEPLGTPAEVVTRWPEDLGLCALLSRPAPDRGSSRWSILAAPSGETIDFAASGVGIEALGRLDVRPNDDAASGAPFMGGWIGWLGYDLGTDTEPTARDARKGTPPRAGRGWLARCEDALLHDNVTGDWFGVGDADRLLCALRPRPSAAACEVGSFISTQGR